MRILGRIKEQRVLYTNQQSGLRRSIGRTLAYPNMPAISQKPNAKCEQIKSLKTAKSVNENF